jgi:Glycosyl transferase family 90
MRWIRMCVVMICVISGACFLSYIANQKNTKKEKVHQEKPLTSDAWKKKCAEKISARNPAEWMREQITSDLSLFADSGITSDMVDTAMQQADRGAQLVRFRIINNQLSVIGQPEPHPRLDSMIDSLHHLCDIAPLPNLDFIICIADAIDGVDFAAPVLAFAKHQDSHKVVLIPDFEALSDLSITLLDNVKRGINKYPWNKKVEKAFWRGSTTGSDISLETFLLIPRSQAVRCSLDYPDLVDARFTQLCQCKNPAEVQEKYSTFFAQPLSVKNHLKYKYQLLIDGNTCAYSRAYWQLFSNCAILKQSSPNLQWFYGLLKPYVHYIPLQHDLSDLHEKIAWSKKHDKKVQKIIDNAQNLAQENLMQQDLYYYLYLVLVEYAKMQRDLSSPLPISAAVLPCAPLLLASA